MVAQFMADAPALRELTQRALPLTDNFPHRISSSPPTARAGPVFAWVMDAARGRDRLRESRWASQVLPPALLAEGQALFGQRAMLDAILHPELRAAGYNTWGDVAALLRGAGAPVLVQWLLDSEAGKAEIAARQSGGAGSTDPEAAEHLAIAALARGGRARIVAPERFAGLTPKGQAVAIFHHCLAGDRGWARAMMKTVPVERRQREPLRSLFAWAAAECAAK